MASKDGRDNSSDSIFTDEDIVYNLDQNESVANIVSNVSTANAPHGKSIRRKATMFEPMDAMKRS